MLRLISKRMMHRVTDAGQLNLANYVFRNHE